MFTTVYAALARSQEKALITWRNDPFSDIGILAALIDALKPAGEGVGHPGHAFAHALGQSGTSSICSMPQHAELVSKDNHLGFQSSPRPIKAHQINLKRSLIGSQYEPARGRSQPFRVCSRDRAFLPPTSPMRLSMTISRRRYARSSRACSATADNRIAAS
jgi:hypothetical protein